MTIIKFYKCPGLTSGVLTGKLQKLKKVSQNLRKVDSELCYYVESESELSKDVQQLVHWILGSPLDTNALKTLPTLKKSPGKMLVEIGPRLNFSTAFSTNAVSIFHSIGLTQIVRVEMSVMYLLQWDPQTKVPVELEEKLVAALHDRMTECQYVEPIQTFALMKQHSPWYEVDIRKDGRKALETVNDHLGLAFDEWDITYYTDLFKNKLKRNPTSVECFDLAQSNSEHSRHWFFKGRMFINGVEQPKSLIDMIIATQSSSNQNNVIKFSDNSSAIEGYETQNMLPSSPSTASPFHIIRGKRHIIFTAETHNFPTGVAPFSGATTGTGGRIRDVQAVGRGGHVVAGTAGYSFGNLLLPDYPLPWEDRSLPYPSNFASAVEVAVEASNGASDYGNKFGEPVISGFARSFGMKLSGGDRREWIKPIMFSGGIGALEWDMVTKVKPEKSMQVVKLGGPVYRIGVGGGAASSVQVQGDNKSELDFNAVQRGDAEMEQKLNRVIRACLEMGSQNPICSIHDQGAGGNGNVLKELVEPEGAIISTKKFQLGDPTINTLELWGAEYQESNAILCRAKDADLLKDIASRERCPVCFVGTVTGNGKIVLTESDIDLKTILNDKDAISGSNVCHPVCLDLEFILGKMPLKVFHSEHKQQSLRALVLPANLNLHNALDRVLRLPSVASKRYLTNKVDRSVTGLVAQQQCVGPMHTPLADVAVIALSYFDKVGSATSIGEQPIKGLLDAAAGARMTVAEAISNLVFAKISSLQDVKCSGNWMWAAKLPGEGAELYSACKAMCDFMSELGIAVDGGKDSLSMAARVDTETVKAPGTLVVSTYAPCPDVTKVVTPDLKCPGAGREGKLIWVNLSGGKSRVGGTALAQCFNQLGDEVPDVEDPQALKAAFEVTQTLIEDGKILAGHDISDGGLITCVFEMAFGGHCGFTVNLEIKEVPVLHTLFAEEVGWVLEAEESEVNFITDAFKSVNVPAIVIGTSSEYGPEAKVQVTVNETTVLLGKMLTYLMMWEDTSFQLEQRQANAVCVSQENASFDVRTGPTYSTSFSPLTLRPVGTVPKVAVVREEGTNGDREMVAALYMAGFEVWDVTMQDILDRKVAMDKFRGAVFPGGFSYADVLGSSKGWAASMLFDPKIKAQFDAFRNRRDTFSLGVCNGCQLMALLGWIGLTPGQKTTPEIFLDHNASERFESRFSTVRIEKSPSIMLKEMEGSVLGVWVAHGEGRFVYKDETVYPGLEANRCLAVKYVDDDGKPTERYPMNPNGSQGGVAGICSMDGRHLAMMPHPERCVLPWQWPWMPLEWKQTMQVSPWLRMFQNAYNWCVLGP